MIRVPLNVGLPWQISGSATINLPSSINPLRERLLLALMRKDYGSQGFNSSKPLFKPKLGRCDKRLMPPDTQRRGRLETCAWLQ
jgi:hypothetical protein